MLGILVLPTTTIPWEDQESLSRRHGCLLPQLHGRSQGILGQVAQVPIVLNKTFGPPRSVYCDLGGMGLQGVWRMAQVGTDRDLRVHVQLRNDCSETSMDKATVLEGLQHGTHQ